MTFLRRAPREPPKQPQPTHGPQTPGGRFLRRAPNNATVSAGKQDTSELLRRVVTTDEDDQMPPPGSNKAPLTTQQKDTLRRWVAEGAEYKTHWAWVAPVQAPLPEMKRTDWPRNALDRFVLA